MLVGRPLSGLLRFCVAAICAALSARAVWLARADWLASAGPLAEMDRAIQMEPGDGNLLALAAIYRSNAGDASPAVDAALQKASQLNPIDARVPMTQGLRAEFRGDEKAAEQYLLRSVELDRQFKPSWTLANFYFRHNQPEKAWPLLRHCLELEPLAYSPDAVFDLCWTMETDRKQILALVPRRNPRLIQYLSWLIRTNKFEEAAEIWPDALAVADPSSENDRALLIPLPGRLTGSGHGLQALRLWNRLVDRGMIHAAHLDPSHGQTLADPQFRFGLTDDPFGWVITEPAGVFSSNAEGMLRFEMDGNQPEAFNLLRTTAAVLPGRRYKLQWEVESDRLSSPDDPGFAFAVTPDSAPDAARVQCAPALAKDKPHSCEFTTAEKTSLASVMLSYTRAPGTTRPHGVILLKNVKVGLAQ